MTSKSTATFLGTWVERRGILQLEWEWKQQRGSGNGAKSNDIWLYFLRTHPGPPVIYIVDAGQNGAFSLNALVL